MVLKRPSARYQALITGLAAVMTLTMIISLNGFWHLNLPFARLLLFTGMATAFGWLCWSRPWVALGLTAAVAGGVALGVYRLPQWARYLALVATEGQGFLSSLREQRLEASFGPAVGQLFLAAAAIGIALLIIQETLGRGNTFWSIIAGAVIFGTQWAWYYDKSATYFTPYAVLAFGLWALGQAARRDATWENTGRKVGYRSQVITPLAWVLAVAMLATLLPDNFAPFDMGTWGERAQEAFPVLKQLRGGGAGGSGGRFSLTATGFSPNMNALGGPVKLDSTVALQLTADQALKQTTYLRGTTFLTYNGKAWLPGDMEYAKVPADGTLPSALGSDVLRQNMTVKVAPAVNLGNTLFGLLEPMKVDGLKSAYRADPDGNLWAERAVPRGTSYQLSARVPTYSADQIRTLSTSAPGETFKPYLALPDTLPRRVGELARSLTRGQTHPYDKAVALEAWLRGMPYDLNVPAAPQGRDFVDYFVFDLRRGYCTYYSTAMSVMLRELGIPSREVEGFALPARTPYTEGNDGKAAYPVLNSMSHAWVEAYFPGYGWVTFDPTPRADLPTIDRSAPAPKAADSQSAGDDSSASGDTPELKGKDRNLVDPGDQDIAPATSTPVQQDLPWAMLLLAVLGALVFLGYKRLRSQDQIRSSEERQVVQEAWQKTSSLMSLFDFGRQPYQTAREYAAAIGVRWPALRDAAAQVAEDYTIARYSPPGHPVDAEAAPRAKSLWEKVHEVIFQRYGWRTYLWRRLRWRKPPAD
jgi:hypothetical protein